MLQDFWFHNIEYIHDEQLVHHLRITYLDQHVLHVHVYVLHGFTHVHPCTLLHDDQCYCETLKILTFENITLL